MSSNPSNFPSDVPPLNPSAPRASQISIEREIRTLKEMVMAEAATAVGMVEQAAEALIKGDETMARVVISRDDEIDRDEVHIEEECFRVLALFHPFAKDFRHITMLLKVNSDIERVADHATGISKQVVKLKKLAPVPPLPTPLVELAQRVPMTCHALLTALAQESVEQAREVVVKDKTLDSLEKAVFDECVNLMTHDRNTKAAMLHMHRCARELERVGDLMKNIAEDLIYLQSGNIVRHEAKRLG
ncbi:MAG: phosphate signaling complex protein PhoU [Phycisphaerales bacterium]|nr:phosphate signaling complex protein PhoU [Phycisphaerales bacterium]